MSLCMSVTAGGHIYEIKSGQHDNTTIHDSVLHFPRSDGVGYMASIVTGPKPAQSNSNQLQAPTNVDAMHVLCLIYQKLPRAIIANVPRCITLALNFMPTWGLTLIRKATASASREWCSQPINAFRPSPQGMSKFPFAAGHQLRVCVDTYSTSTSTGCVHLRTAPQCSY